MKNSEFKEDRLDSFELNKLIKDNSVELSDSYDLNELINTIGEAKYVLLGEASHGTHEYYTWRMQISKRLIEEKGFSFIAVEGDWPDCYRVNRYVKNYSDSEKKAVDVLSAFERWPTWMWANWEIAALTEWLRDYNKNRPLNFRVGFYGLDVYSLLESLEAIIKYLGTKDKKTQNTAINALNCFENYGDVEGQSYARATAFIPESCEDEVIKMLIEIQKNMIMYNTDPEAVMSAEQNAYVTVNAERYYRAMVRPGPASWNIRDQHMVDTLNRLMKFYGNRAKSIVWEHNTHVGDARTTNMARQGMINVGQLLNEHHESDGVFTVGFGSYSGTVIAATEWGAVMREMEVPQAVPGSWEDIMHQLESKMRIVFMNNQMKKQIGKKNFGHRAIGVVYHPEYEYSGNYVPTLIPLRYNAFIFLDETSALHPLHIKPHGHLTPETFPFGF